MTIASTASEVSYGGNGVTVAFDIPFVFDTSADLKVTSTDSSGNVTTLTTGFSIGGGAGSTGTITFTTAPASGVTITILDNPTLTQPTDYTANDAFSAESHETALDRGARISKRLYQLIRRSLRTADGDPISDLTLGSVDNRKGKYLFFNAVTGAVEYAAALVTTALSQSIIGLLLFPQTSAEASAGVTPTNYFWPELYVERYGGIADNSTDNATAIARAMSVASSKGGGEVFFASTGTYRTSAQVAFTESVKWKGLSYLGTIIKYTGSSTFITLGSVSARNEISTMTITGTSKTGTGVQIGDTNFSGFHRLYRCNINGFATGVRLAGALYTTLEECIVQLNNRGVDFNAGWASGYSTTVEFIRCDVRSNDNEGYAATNVPIRNQSISWRGGAIELNCTSSPGTTSQHVLGTVEQFKIDNVYYEYSAGGTKPNAIDISLASDGEIMCFVNNSRNGVTSGTTSVANIKIKNSRFIGTTGNDILVNGGAGVAINVTAEKCEFSATNVMNGTDCYVFTKRMAEVTNQGTSWTPTIRGSGTAGTPTYSAQSGTYSKVGNLVFFQVRVSITAKGGMVGAITIEGLPVAAATQAGTESTFAAQFDGVTVSGGNTCFFAALPSGSTSLQLYQGGSAASAQIVDTAVAAASSFYISGCYQT